ncbi:MAG TPA: MerR family transcriptional regulator [Amoebophilaceae bacterium]|nr:MerR family transcriptional regulator [Amoebophilaceae bacterium]
MIPNIETSNNIKKYYAIGEVARLLNVSTSLIRFWEKKFPSLQPQKNKQGTRRYTQADIVQLRNIYQLVKEQGYTLQGARKAMKHNGSKLQSHADIVHVLKNLKDFLALLKENVINTD